MQTSRLLKKLVIPASVPVVTGDDTEKAKPSPDVFVLAAERLGLPVENCIVTGDSVWDVLAAARKRALGVGLLSGGYSEEELGRAGAFRIYSDPADMLEHIEDLGIEGPWRSREWEMAARKLKSRQAQILSKTIPVNHCNREPSLAYGVSIQVAWRAPVEPRAANTRSGVRGRKGTRTPKALATALEIAAPGEITGGSPIPITPRSS
jgi:hypothetical protein